jgi:hypothetical protein
MYNLTLSEELDGISDIGVVDETKDVVIRRPRLLLCCTFI